jgi:hypothetical protein
MRIFLYISVAIFIFFHSSGMLCAQEKIDSSKPGNKNITGVEYIERLDTMFHLRTLISKHQMNYRLVYNKNFRLILAPNRMNNLSFDFSYRYLDLSVSFTPEFLNPAQKNTTKGKSDIFSLGTSLSMHRFYLAVELNSVQGFYLKNSNEFVSSTIPDSPYLVYPGLQVNNFGLMLRYNVNPKFSTAALTSGTQIQKKSAYTFLPALQFATFRFTDAEGKQEVQNKSTYSTDVNILLPLAGTLVISPKFSASLGAGPSIGIDFFKSVAIDNSSKLVLSKGTGFSSGFTAQAAIGFHTGRLFAGAEGSYRSYGHKIEDLSRMTKQYFFYQVFAGWRLKAPGFAKKALDWVNKISPVDLD